MALVLIGLLVFAALAAVVLGRAGNDGDRDLPWVLATWFAYLVHADAVALTAFLDTGRVGVPSAVALGVGVPIAACGLVLFVAAARKLLAAGEGRPFEPATLVTDGPYRYMRHPQDTGWALLLLGVAVAGRSAIGLALVAIFAVFVRQLWRHEEARLERRFGAVGTC